MGTGADWRCADLETPPVGHRPELDSRARLGRTGVEVVEREYMPKEAKLASSNHR